MQVNQAFTVQKQQFKATQNQPTQVEQKEEKSGSGKLLLALGGLAILGAGAYLWHKNKTNPDETIEKAVKKIEDKIEQNDTPATHTDTPEVQSPKPDDVKPEPAKTETQTEIYGPNLPFIRPKHFSDAEIAEKAKKLAGVVVEKQNYLDAIGKTFREEQLRPLEERTKNVLPNAIGIFGEDKAQIKDTVRDLSALTNTKLESLSIKNLPFQKFCDELEQKMENSSLHYRKTGQITLIHIGDTEELFKDAAQNNGLKDLNDWLHKEMDDSNPKRSFRLVYSAAHEGHLPAGIITPQRTGLQLHTKSYAIPERTDAKVLEGGLFGGGIIKKLHAESVERICDLIDAFKFVHKHPQYQQMEHPTISIPKKLGLYGKDAKEARAIVKKLPELLDANLKTVAQEGKGPTYFIEAIQQATKSAGETFQKTGKATIVDIGDLDSAFATIKAAEKDETKRYKLEDDLLRAINNKKENTGSMVVYNAQKAETANDWSDPIIKLKSFYTQDEEFAYQSAKTLVKAPEDSAMHPIEKLESKMTCHDAIRAPYSIQIVSQSKFQTQMLLDNIATITHAELADLGSEKRGVHDIRKELEKLTAEASERYKKSDKRTLIYMGTRDDLAKRAHRGFLEEVINGANHKNAQEKGITYVFSSTTKNSISNPETAKNISMTLETTSYREPQA